MNKINQQTNYNISDIDKFIVPLNPADLIESLKVIGTHNGEYYFNKWNFTIAVPALTGVAVDVLVPYGHVIVFYKQHRIISDFYSPYLYFNIDMDTHTFDLTPFSIPLTNSKDVQISYYLPYRQQLTYNFRNTTITDALITLEYEEVVMSVDFYENWYRVILARSEKILNELVFEARGRL